jgi:RHS repeat-associated protein
MKAFRTYHTGYYYYGARYYDPAVGYFLSVDPLVEKYPGMSPYHYTFDYPVRFIDPDGRKIAPASQKKYARMKNRIIARRDRLKRKISRLQAKAAKKGWSAEKLAKRIGNKQDRFNILNDLTHTLGVLESSKQVYRLNSASAHKNLSYDNSTGEIVINYDGTTAMFAHETTHAGQFETQDLAFTLTGELLAQDVFDEIAGYKSQWAYEPSTVGGLKSVNQITVNFVQGITDASGDQPYKPGGSNNTGIIPININSTRDDLIKAYPHRKELLQTLPANFTIKSMPNIYYKK